MARRLVKTRPILPGQSWFKTWKLRRHRDKWTVLSSTDLKRKAVNLIHIAICHLQKKRANSCIYLSFLPRLQSHRPYLNLAAICLLSPGTSKRLASIAETIHSQTHQTASPLNCSLNNHIPQMSTQVFPWLSLQSVVLRRAATASSGGKLPLPTDLGKKKKP
jgi:hypothetical protein